MSIVNSASQIPSPAGQKIVTVWPGIGSMALGRWVGRLAGNPLGLGFFTLGKVLAIATIPVSLAVYLWRLMPTACRRYTLTSRRIIIQRGLTAKDGPSIGLDEFDTIESVVLPGQGFLHAGDLIFKREGAEVFRLPGVCRPEAFRQVCLKARTALLRGRQVSELQTPVVARPN
jgi:hypothetical protein